MSIINEKDFNKSLVSIKKQGESLATEVHNAGMFALLQANTHGNTGFGVRLIEALGKKHDAKRVEKWLMHFGKFGIKDGLLCYRKRKDITAENFDATMQKAEATPYWELTAQEHAVFKVDYLAQLKSLLAKHEKAVQLRSEGKDAEEKNEGLLGALKAVLQAHETAPVATQA